MHITFPTARPPTTERMTPQTLITRVCKTEMTGTAHHVGGTRNTTAAVTGDVHPASHRSHLILSLPSYGNGVINFLLGQSKKINQSCSSQRQLPIPG